MVYLKNISTTYRAAFETKVKTVATDLKILPDWLMTVMYAESKLNHRAVNKASNATGLIQFLPSTAITLGTTVSSLKAMTPIQQLDYVHAYLRPYRGRMTNVYETYLAVFYPVAIGKADSYILFSKGSAAYSQNAALDMDKDGRVSKKDVKTWFGKYVKEQGFIMPNLLLLAGVGVVIAASLKTYSDAE